MFAPCPNPLSYKRVVADVAGPQDTSDGSIAWPFGKISAMVAAGRTQAACLLKRRLWGDTSPAVQDYWSRGCPRAHVSYLVFACWRLSPAAPKRKKPSLMWQSRSQPSLLTQANTSDLMRRAAGGNLCRHAALSGRICQFVRLRVAVGLSVLCYPMLKTVAVPPTQDRSLC